MFSTILVMVGCGSTCGYASHQKDVGRCAFLLEAGAKSVRLCAGSVCEPFAIESVDGKKCLVNLPTEQDLQVEIDGRVERVRLSRLNLASIVANKPVAFSIFPLSPRLIQLRVASAEQSAGWEIRRGGKKAGKKIAYESRPLAQPFYPIGSNKNDDPRVILEERITFELNTPLKSQELLVARHSSGNELNYPFDEMSSFSPIVQLNQVGYAPGGKRFAYFSYWLGRSLKESELPKRIFVVEGASEKEFRPKYSSSKDKFSELIVGEIDLADVVGDFHIRIPGVGRSMSSTVSKGAVKKTLDTLMFALRHKRFSSPVDKGQSDWSRPRDHVAPIALSGQKDGFEMLPEKSPRNKTIKFRGGHFDAGDFDIRPSHTVVAQQLMAAYELFPKAFTDGQFRLSDGEKSNGIPDLLDEALYSLLAWEKLQGDSGGVRSGVESHRHPYGIYRPDEDPLPYWAFAEDAQVSARAAALFAQASRLIAAFDKPRADALRDRAEQAYRFAEKNGAKASWLLYAESELFALTKTPLYREKLSDHWSSFGPDGIFNNLAVEHLSLGDYADEGRVMPDFVMAYLMSGEASEQHVASAKKWFMAHADEVVKRSKRYRHRNFLRNDRFGWGQAVVMGRYLDPIFARLRLGGLSDDDKKAYFDAISIGADYMLGANPNGLVWMTGLGKEYVRRPLDLDSLVSLSKGQEAIPGIVVFGPASEVPSYDWMKPALDAFSPTFEKRPPAFRYGDVRTLAPLNEFSVWETQAPAIRHFAALYALSSAPDFEN